MIKRVRQRLVNDLLNETARLLEFDVGGAGEGPNDGYASQGLFKIFAEPLKDIFSALKFTAMDVSNALQLVVKTALNFYNPQKLNEIKSEYEFKQSKLLKQWGPIVSRSISSIKNADPFMTLAISPHLFMVTKILTKSIEAGKTTAEILAGEDWNSIINKINRVPDERTGFGAIIRQQQQSSKETNNLLTRLNSIFASKSRRNESLIREQNEQDKKYSSAEEFLQDFFKETGLDKEFNDTANIMLDDKITFIKEAAKQLVTALSITRLMKTKSIDEFTETLKQLSMIKEIDKSAIDKLETMMNNIKQKSLTLSKDEKFLEELAKKEKVKEVSDDQAKKAAIEIVFLSSKQQFDKSNADVLKKFKIEIPQIYKQVALDEKTLSSLKNRKSELSNADKFLKIYTTFISYYKEFNALVG